MKEFRCGNMVPGCDWHTRHDDTAEIIRRAVDHLQTAHGHDHVGETTIEAIRSKITKAESDD